MKCLSSGCYFPGLSIPRSSGGGGAGAVPASDGLRAPPSRQQPPLAAGAPGSPARQLRASKVYFGKSFLSTNSAESKAIEIGNGEGKSASCAKRLVDRKGLRARPEEDLPRRCQPKSVTDINNLYLCERTLL